MTGADSRPYEPGEWKQAHARLSQQALDHELVRDVIEEFAENMGFEAERLCPSDLSGVHRHLADAVGRQALVRVDPDLLRHTDDEANRALMERAARLVYGGVPTFVVGADPEATS